MIKKERIGWSVGGAYYRFNRWQLALIVKVLDAAGGVLFCLRRKTIAATPRSVLVIQLDHIGDMILNSSLIGSIRGTYPDAKITVLIRSLARPVAEAIEGIDEILHLHTPWLSREKNSGWAGVFTFCLRHFKSYDLVFEVHGEARNNFIAWMLGKFRVGAALRGGGFFLNKSISWEREYDVHICRMQTRMLDAVTGRKNRTLQPHIVIPLTVQQCVSEILEKNGLNERHYVLIQMSVGATSREWPIAHWKTFTAAVTGRGYHIVCADLDRVKVSFVKPPDSRRFHTLSVSLIEYAELVKRAQAVVSVETFCGHIASCFATPTLSLYSGVTFWDEWRPFNDRIRHLQDTSCSNFPCGRYECPFGYYSPCMKNITPEMALAEFEALIDRG
ncbi:MAG: glycosyltransferase family 9 protein [Chitinispirillaceae bacterium]|nr:glycosyltransferase family 9 protein [Chitinispirillaceae bacterium]